MQLKLTQIYTRKGADREYIVACGRPLVKADGGFVGYFSERDYRPEHSKLRAGDVIRRWSDNNPCVHPRWYEYFLVDEDEA
jgi:hypothetical protein